MERKQKIQHTEDEIHNPNKADFFFRTIAKRTPKLKPYALKMPKNCMSISTVYQMSDI